MISSMMFGPIDSKDEVLAQTFSARVMRELEKQEWSASSSIAFKTIYQMGRQVAIDLVKEAGVRDRAGAGFPTAEKWVQVRYAESEHKYFICNAASSQPGSMKEGWLIRANPLKVIESVAIATHCVGAEVGYLCLPKSCREEMALLEAALQAAYESGILGSNVFGAGTNLYLNVVGLPDSCANCGEFELLALMEGKAPQPRETLLWPPSHGLFGKPTVVNNLETVLQCRYALKVGPQVYRELGTGTAPGTMIFTLAGHVNRPGLYELPLGTGLRELILDRGEGVSGASLKAVFPGGLGSAILRGNALDARLDFDSMREAGSNLGSGVVIAFGDDTCMVELATDLARFFGEASSGRCIDTIKGLDKVLRPSEFFNDRGDCHFSNEAAISVASLLSAFRDEFDHHMRFGYCPLISEPATWDFRACLPIEEPVLRP